MEEFVASQKELLKEEHNAEIEECLTLQKSLPLSQLQNRGICIKKLHIVSLKTGLYGRIIAKFGLRGSPDRPLPSNSFSSGDIVDVHLKTTTNFSKPEVQGVVINAKETSINIAFDGEGTQSKADELYSNDASLTLIKTSNEVTYRRLQKGLENLQCHTGPASNLLDICFGSATPTCNGTVAEPEYYNESLNPSQKDAVLFSLSQRDLAVIHGPPGTGKTTTIAEIITQFVIRKERVLACAPSNVAIDNILEKLSSITIIKDKNRKSSIRMVRIGHPARILTPELQKLSLDAVISKSDSAKIVQDVRRDIDNLHRKFRKKHNKAEQAKLREEKKILNKELKEREKKVIYEILSSADVVLATNVGAHCGGPLKHLPADHFQVVVIDECGQALEASCWIPILRAPKAILAGDHLQLPPTVKSRVAAENGLSTSLLERITNRHKDAVKMLDIQYRMNSSIMNWSSKELYETRLKAHISVQDHTLHQLKNVNETEDTVLPILLIDTAGCNMPEIQTADSDSIGNTGEANIVKQHVESLIQAGVSPSDIAIISPYNLQVDILRKLLKEKYSALEIRSVDGFQGREKEAVIISMVRSNDKGVVGFLSDNRRMNVAVTRARRHLTVVGDSDTVGRHTFLKSLLNYISTNGEVRSGYQYSDVDRGITEVNYSVQHNDRSAKKPNSKHDLNDAKVRLKKVIDDFMKMAKAGGPNLYEFSNTLFGYERLAVHELCEEMGIYHISSGEGGDRKISIALKAFGNEPTSKNKSEVEANQAECIKSAAPKDFGNQNEHETKSEDADNSLASQHYTPDDASNAIESTMEASKQILLCSEPEVSIHDYDICNARMHPHHIKDMANTELTAEIAYTLNEGKLAVSEPMEVSICEICGRELPSANVDLHKIHCERLQAMKEKLQAMPTAKVKKHKKKMQNTSHKRKTKHSSQTVEETDDDLLDRAIQANKQCTISGCDKFVSVLGRNCTFCKRLFCLEHHMPELHGCGSAAHLAARRQISRDGVVYRGSGTPTKKLPPEKHAVLQRKLGHKLKEMENKRKVSSKKRDQK